MIGDEVKPTRPVLRAQLSFHSLHQVAPAPPEVSERARSTGATEQLLLCLHARSQLLQGDHGSDETCFYWWRPDLPIATVMPIFAKTAASHHREKGWEQPSPLRYSTTGGPIHAHNGFEFCPETLEIYLAILLGTLTRIAPRRAPLNPTLRVY